MTIDRIRHPQLTERPVIRPVLLPPAPPRDLLGDGEGLIDWNGTLLDAISQGRPFHPLHYERLGVVRLLDAMNGGDVGVVPSEAIRVSRECVRQDLQRDPSLPGRRVGLVVVPAAVNLLRDDEGGTLISAARALEPKMVIFDTLARCMVGGDENSPADIGRRSLAPTASRRTWGVGAPHPPPNQIEYR